MVYDVHYVNRVTACLRIFMKKMFIPMLVLLVVFTGCLGLEKEIIIPLATIQQMTEKKFPLEKKFEKKPLAATIKFFSPNVFFQDNSIGISAQYTGSLLLRKINGNISFKCKPVYKPGKTSFYLSDFEIVQLTMNNETISENDKAMAIISLIVKDIFEDYPIYKLKQDDYKQNLARLILKNITVRDNDLVLLISF